MKNLLLLALLLATPSYGQDADPVLEGFKRQATAELEALGSSYAGCTATVVDKQKDGPGRLIEFACKHMPFRCVFVAVPAPSEYGIAAQAIGCEDNADYQPTTGS